MSESPVYRRLPVYRRTVTLTVRTLVLVVLVSAWFGAELARPLPTPVVEAHPVVEVSAAPPPRVPAGRYTRVPARVRGQRIATVDGRRMRVTRRCVWRVAATTTIVCPRGVARS